MATFPVGTFRSTDQYPRDVDRKEIDNKLYTEYFLSPTAIYNKGDPVSS